jgi:hypothetical protein
MAAETTTPDPATDLATDADDSSTEPQAEGKEASSQSETAEREAPSSETAEPPSGRWASLGRARQDQIAAGAAALVVTALVLFKIGSFGIWDPWELAAADLARNVSEGEALDTAGPPLGAWLVAQGFSIFGIHEWAGRLPIAISGLLALLALGWGMARASGVRAGALAAVITASTPLFLLNSRGMMGAAPGFLGSALVFFFALELATVETEEGRTAADVQRARIIAGVGLLFALVLSALGSGILLGVAPPLLGVGAALIARGEVVLESTKNVRAMIATGVVALAALIGLGVTRAILGDVAGYSMWLGGAPHELQPGTFEVVIEQVFHGFAPWTAVLPIGFGWLAFREDTPDRPLRQSVLGLGAVAWAAFAFAAVTMYSARYGSAPYPAPIALGIVAAVGLLEVQRHGGGSWAAGLVAGLLAMLLLRDFRGYPITPTGALALTGLTEPEGFNPTRLWAAVLVPFALFAFLGFARDREESMDGFREDLGVGQGGARIAKGILTLGFPVDAIRAGLQRGGAHAAWLWMLATLTFGVLTYGILSWALPDDARPQGIVAIATVSAGLVFFIVRLVIRFGRTALFERPAVRFGLALLAALLVGVSIATGILSIEGLSSLALRVGRYLLFVPFGIVIAIAAFRAIRYGFHALGEMALAPLVIMGVVVGGYVSFSWQPALSQHFSPREVYDTYNGLAQPGEPLGEYRVSGRAAAYYTHGDVEEIEGEATALTFLARESRVWLAFRADDLSSLDRAYRARSGHHLFLADARSSNVLLATNQPIEGRADENYLAGAILDEAPAMEFPVGASFDRRIELVGYDLETARPGRIGPGDQIVVTWYWRCTAPVPGSYQIFLHVDGMGQRLNGDHEPVEGRYPVRLWSAGDIIVDRQEMRIPANFPPGTYSFNIGFYSGESRLEVVEGAEDDANRAIAGTITVR